MKKNRIMMTLKAVDVAGAEEKVREWILKEKPSEKELIGDFDPEVTFREVAERMLKGEDFYEVYQEFFVIRNSSHRLFVLGLVI